VSGPDWDAWSPVQRGKGRQTEGAIRVPGRNSARPVNGNHQNRAGHRAYVKFVQTRLVRMHTVGFGRWRRHVPIEDRKTWMSVLTARPPIEPRRFRRIDMIEDYRTHRKNRLAAGRLRGQ
jgi:hypothetical protein